MLDAADITACLVTKGDRPDLLALILESLPYKTVVWNNAERGKDLKVYGRYEVIAEADTPYVYFQDDDCLIRPWAHERLAAEHRPGQITGFMPTTHGVGEPHILVGWGALCDRGLPKLAFERWVDGGGSLDDLPLYADIIFASMTPHRRISIGTDRDWHMAVPESPVFHLPTAFMRDRMHNQPSHARRGTVLGQALEIIRAHYGDPDWRGDTA